MELKGSIRYGIQISLPWRICSAVKPSGSAAFFCVELRYCISDFLSSYMHGIKICGIFNEVMNCLHTFIILAKDVNDLERGCMDFKWTGRSIFPLKVHNTFDLFLLVISSTWFWLTDFDESTRTRDANPTHTKQSHQRGNSRLTITK